MMMAAAMAKDDRQQLEEISYEEVEQICTYLRTKTQIQTPEIGIICGSGLGGLADLITQPDVIEYADIPGFPLSTGAPFSVASKDGSLSFTSL